MFYMYSKLIKLIMNFNGQLKSQTAKNHYKYMYMYTHTLLKIDQRMLNIVT